MKDLLKLGNDFNLKETVIVDNIPENYILQFENGVTIKTWLNDNEDDDYLLRLKGFLKQLAEVDDVRRGILKI